MTIDSSSLLQMGSMSRSKNSQSQLEAMTKKMNSSTPPKKGGGEDQRLRQACSDFQSIFIKQMLDSMRGTVQKSGLLDGGQAEEMFEDMLYDEYAQKMSKTADLGLDDMLYQQLSGKKHSV